MYNKNIDYYDINNLIELSNEDIKILIGSRNTGKKQYLERYVIKQYEEEIRRGVAICKDFKISFEKFFKIDYMKKYAYELAEDNNKLNSVYYSIQLLYNDIYKKYNNKYYACAPLLQNILNNIKGVYGYLSKVFDYDIIKEIDEQIKPNYKDVK